MTPIEPTDAQIAAIKESLDRNPLLNDYARAQALKHMVSDLTRPPMSQEEAIEQYKMIERQSRQRKTSRESPPQNSSCSNPELL
jgi:hypothetical protein